MDRTPTLVTDDVPDTSPAILPGFRLAAEHVPMTVLIVLALSGLIATGVATWGTRHTSLPDRIAADCGLRMSHARQQPSLPAAPCDAPLRYAESTTTPP